MDALARVGGLIFMDAVEIAEAVFVLREMRRHPVQDDADAVLMELIDQIHEILGSTIRLVGAK